MDTISEKYSINVCGGNVTLIDVLPRIVEGGIPESAIVDAARISYANTTFVSTDENLIRYLYRNEHMTPFEMIVLKFAITAPIFTARQWMRHRSGSFNEQSARYSDVSDSEFYTPDEVYIQSHINKQSSGALADENISSAFIAECQTSYDKSREVYKSAISSGIAREMARFVLPESRMTKFYWQVNLRNLFGFLKLRLDKAAQDNIRQYANAIFEILKKYCPIACKAFSDYTLNSITLSELDINTLKTGIIDKKMTSREIAELKIKADKIGVTLNLV